MKQKIEERGRSMIEMLGVLSIIGVLTFAGFAGYEKAITKSRINKTMETVGYMLQGFADSKTKNIRGINISGEDAMESAISAGLAENCELIDSVVDEGYSVCDVPLGEVYVKFQDKGRREYSYMLFVTMIKEAAVTCTEFLMQGWDKAIPENWWDNGMIWVSSDKNSSGVVAYSEGQYSVSAARVGDACDRGCPKGSDYCSVVFDLAAIK